MNHLSDSEFVDLVEGQLAPERAGHAEQCAECRGRADRFRALLGAMRTDAVPEPSPLFWDHFSARVATAIDAEGRPASQWALWCRSARVQWAVAAVALVLAAGVTWRTLMPASSVTVPPAPQFTGVGGPADADADDILDQDAWHAIVLATDAFELDDTEALDIRVRPGSAERMAEELTAEERSELARLIEDELKRTGA